MSSVRKELSVKRKNLRVGVLLCSMFKNTFLEIIRWPLLARGTKAMGLGLVRLSTSSRHVFSYQAICC